jgi:hypothetical protein
MAIAGCGFRISSAAMLEIRNPQSEIRNSHRVKLFVRQYTGMGRLILATVTILMSAAVLFAQPLRIPHSAFRTPQTRPATLSGPPAVFPLPREAAFEEPPFPLPPDTVILLPAKPSANDLYLARFLVAELSDRYGLALRMERVAGALPKRPGILIGSISSPLVSRMCASRGLRVSATDPGPEGYVLHVDERGVVVAGSDDAGAFYGLQSLRQIIERDAGGIRVRGAAVRDAPYKPFRAVKAFLPGRDHIPFFKRFMRDFMALYKYNRLVLEMNAGMRLDRHPEVNAGWIDLARDLNFTRRDRSTGPGEQYQNSVHHDTADGGVLEKEEVAELVRYARRHHIEVIPEIPSLTHSYYLLARHRELAEIQDAEWPDTYCPLNPKSYELLFDVLDEYLEVTRPNMVHAGKDEWRMPVNVCPRCKGKDSRDLLVQDLNKIYDYLKKRGVRMAIWGDHLMESVRGNAPVPKTSPSGYAYRIPGALTPEQVRTQIPKDILVFNWFWNDREAEYGSGEQNDITLQQWGFQQVYGNFTPYIENYGRRGKRPDVLGGAPSAWAVSSEMSLGKDRMREFIGCANLLWSTHWPDQKALSQMVLDQMPSVRRSLSGQAPPSESGDPVVPVKIDGCHDAGAGQAGFDLGRLRTGTLRGGSKTFQISAAGCLASASGAGVAVPVGEDASSLIFLHAAARPAANDWADQYVYNVEDTADLLGWYEVVYQDGLVLTIPIRYGVNVLEWNSDTRDTKSYCYGADRVQAGTAERPFDLFALEWMNPRLGKTIKEVRLKAASGFRNTKGEITPRNPLLLNALSLVRKRTPPTSAGRR